MRVRDGDIEGIADDLDRSMADLRRYGRHAVKDRDGCVRLQELQAGLAVEDQLVDRRAKTTDFLVRQ